MPGVLLGIPYHISEYAPDPYSGGVANGTLTSDQIVACLANLKEGYAIADSIDGEFVDLEQKFYPAKGWGFVTAYDGGILNPDAFALLKVG